MKNYIANERNGDRNTLLSNCVLSLQTCVNFTTYPFALTFGHSDNKIFKTFEIHKLFAIIEH